MHTHIGAVAIVSGFIGVLLCGTALRLSAAHMVNSNSPTLANLGKALAFQY